ncbi:GspE/PulE family protein [Effusibacillus consociatus]|uniref:GspE/PulE family protein n=1 Tax=Effusibacillus consociatus TaxID=1117041 RepID=A0ABV9Q786_9BACL
MQLLNTSDWVQHVIELAFEVGASDIHIEPSKEGYDVRMRKDGDLQSIPNLPPCEGSSVQRIKVLAEMDIAERRLPQDGSFQMQMQESVLDIRVASLPTVEGEKLALRLLRHTSKLQDLEELQMEPKLLHDFRRLLKQSHGMVIAAGPTGSGKSTTLFAALRFLLSRHLNIVTLEDPVESRIAGINQVQINERAGLTFARGLRSVLRQDPDVIMVGEIRDRETAEIAVRAALTGHLVLTTLHTETKEGALIRLVDLGVEPYLVGVAVKGVLSQRLVKRNAGGRRAIFDLLTVTDEVKDWLQQGAPPMHKPIFMRENFLESTLRKLILQGEVIAEEYERICGGDLVWLQPKQDGKVIGSSPDFVHEWPDSYEADSLSTRA